MKRLSIIIPVSILLIFILLYSLFDSAKAASLVILAIPFSFIGGILALFFSGIYLSVPALVGFITLFGTAVLDGTVMLSYFLRLRAKGVSLREAIETGAMLKLRPVLMTTATTVLGVAPLLFSLGAGSEIQRPLATVVVGGAFTSTILTLLLLPTLYYAVELRRKGEEEKE